MEKLSLKEKVGYALGDGAANIAWRGVATFLFIFYTDVFGISPAAVGVLMLIARFGDGIIDVLMGIVCDRTNSKYGKFRPWILWTAIPLGNNIIHAIYISKIWSDRENNLRLFNLSYIFSHLYSK